MIRINAIHVMIIRRKNCIHAHIKKQNTVTDQRVSNIDNATAARHVRTIAKRNRSSPARLKSLAHRASSAEMRRMLVFLMKGNVCGM